MVRKPSRNLTTERARKFAARKLDMIEAHEQSPRRFRAVAFDLLTALIDSWSLWIEVAGDAELGKKWRRNSLLLVTSAGDYSCYEKIVYESADAVGVSSEQASSLLQRWAAGELRPWPETRNVLGQLTALNWPTAVVTNCSQRLAEAAAIATGHSFRSIVSAEAAGAYKTDARAYRAGISALGDFDPSEVLFVAGSAHDVPGAGAIGMPVYWSNRFADTVAPGAPIPLKNERNLLKLPELLAAGPL
jgi:2-haloalkanoic acid dehalogenase type II